ncbi:MAG: hypothetical protein R3F61_37125 [Myxococcota bacterium]
MMFALILGCTPADELVLDAALRDGDLQLVTLEDGLWLALDGGSMAPVDCVWSGADADCGGAEVRTPWQSIRVDGLSLGLVDDDGDSRADAAEVWWDGYWTSATDNETLGGPLGPETRRFERDRVGPEVALARPDQYDASVIPVGPLLWVPSEPVRYVGPVRLDTSLGSYELEPVPAGAPGVAQAFRIDALPALPWSEPLSVDGSGLADLAGNPVPSVSASVVARPSGTWSSNPGFESTGGWWPQPILSTTAWEGASSARIAGGTSLVTPVDGAVPGDLLGLWVSGEPEPGASITLYDGAGVAQVLWDAGASASVGEWTKVEGVVQGEGPWVLAIHQPLWRPQVSPRSLFVDGMSLRSP